MFIRGKPLFVPACSAWIVYLPGTRYGIEVFAMKAVLTSGGQELAMDVTVAESLTARMRGLLGMPSLPVGHGLLLRPCKGIHTFFMRFPIDAVFLDRDNRIVALYHSLQPNRLTLICRKAYSVLELPAGTIGDSVTVGDMLTYY
jgi:uncharacterized membrane protein (UPF0127 family)